MQSETSDHAAVGPHPTPPPSFILPSLHTEAVYSSMVHFVDKVAKTTRGGVAMATLVGRTGPLLLLNLGSLIAFHTICGHNVAQRMEKK